MNPQPPLAAQREDARSYARSLWHRYRAATPLTGAPSALDLAAYAEDRIRGAAKDTVEAALARNPRLLADVIAARAAFIAAKSPLQTRPGIIDRLGWAAALCGFCLAVWVGFATGEQVASSDNEAYTLYSTAGDDNADL